MLSVEDAGGLAKDEAAGQEEGEDARWRHIATIAVAELLEYEEAVRVWLCMQGQFPDDRSQLRGHREELALGLGISGRIDWWLSFARHCGVRTPGELVLVRVYSKMMCSKPSFST